MNEINFFTPVSYLHYNAHKKWSLLETVDHYFYLGGKKAYIIHERADATEVNLADGEISSWEKVVKFVSYCFILPPLFFLCLKGALRWKYRFTVIKNNETPLSTTNAKVHSSLETA